MHTSCICGLLAKDNLVRKYLFYTRASQAYALELLGFAGTDVLHQEVGHAVLSSAAVCGEEFIMDMLLNVGARWVLVAGCCSTLGLGGCWWPGAAPGLCEPGVQTCACLRP